MCIWVVDSNRAETSGWDVEGIGLPGETGSMYGVASLQIESLYIPFKVQVWSEGNRYGAKRLSIARTGQVTERIQGLSG